jgi:hypothetical protein
VQTQYLVQPYKVGKHKKSLAMILPSDIVKTLQIDPLTILLLLKVKGIDEIQLKIIREEDLAKKHAENIEPFQQVPMFNQQASSEE